MRKIKPKQDEYAVGIGPSKKAKSKPVYPTFRIDLSHLPEAKKWELGKKYRLELELVLTGLSQSRFDNTAEFEIHGIEPESDSDERKEGENPDKTETEDDKDDEY